MGGILTHIIGMIGCGVTRESVTIQEIAGMTPITKETGIKTTGTGGIKLPMRFLPGLVMKRQNADVEWTK
jgi:hypothetical protein